MTEMTQVVPFAYPVTITPLTIKSTDIFKIESWHKL